ncbi:GNAT family N-acetyltransferase [Novosphingobium sp. JCM 18896]|uniref:GNAT family N-acetyltransferase n=1 Tax=Novosphingobium sp. JCM 18896 TaxID=2989731 RepID=UPI0022214AFA|nr:GNAT family N-acetyltransferase [Novosphingobium sp. JCM 18896]MCW1429369.1 GNAT family N-acetyltransferase [Novosphingobium sp. JCM 18896]
MSDTPLLRTERFELWQPRLGDLPGLVELIADEETRRFLGAAVADEKTQFEKLLKNAGGWSLYGYGAFHARLPGEGAIIASCGVFHSWRGFGHGMDDVPEAGWVIHRDHWGQGVAKEAMRAILAWFDAVHGPRRIAAMIEDGHVASFKIAAALGFVAYGRQEHESAPVTLLERLPG